MICIYYRYKKFNLKQIDQSLVKIIEAKTDNREIEKSLISEDETVLWFWEKSEWNRIN